MSQRFAINRFKIFRTPKFRRSVARPVVLVFISALNNRKSENTLMFKLGGLDYIHNLINQKKWDLNQEFTPETFGETNLQKVIVLLNSKHLYHKRQVSLSYIDLEI